MDPRIRRLTADHERANSVFAGHKYIHIVSAEGSPPEKYLFAFALRGLVPADGQPMERSEHRAEVHLPLDYPRRAPFCRMVTPVFHPNIDPQKICIGDHWSAGQTLEDLVFRIAEMIAFQSYNVKSPLNAEAAAWTEQNANILPIDPRNFRSLS